MTTLADPSGTPCAFVTRPVSVTSCCRAGCCAARNDGTVEPNEARRWPHEPRATSPHDEVSWRIPSGGDRGGVPPRPALHVQSGKTRRCEAVTGSPTLGDAFNGRDPVPVSEGTA